MRGYGSITSSRGAFGGFKSAPSLGGSFGGYGRGLTRPRYGSSGPSYVGRRRGGFTGYGRSVGPRYGLPNGDRGSIGGNSGHGGYTYGHESDFGEKNDEVGAIAGFGNQYGDRSPNINKDRVYDSDNSGDFPDK